MALIESFPDVKVIKAKTFNDERGSFYKLMSIDLLKYAGVKKPILEINRSITNNKGAIRGMHFQYPPFHETKIISCLRGCVNDVVVDIKKDSPTFLDHISIELCSDLNNIIIIPGGYAHGFQTLCCHCELIYFHDQIYNKDKEGALRYDDPALSIKWNQKCTDISKRDRMHNLIDNTFTGLNL